MAGIVNLNKARKKKARADKAARADENRARFGRTKGERQRQDALKERADRHLDGHRRTEDDPE